MNEKLKSAVKEIREATEGLTETIREYGTLDPHLASAALTIAYSAWNETREREPWPQTTPPDRSALQAQAMMQDVALPVPTPLDDDGKPMVRMLLHEGDTVKINGIPVRLHTDAVAYVPEGNVALLNTEKRPRSDPSRS